MLKSLFSNCRESIIVYAFLRNIDDEKKAKMLSLVKKWGGTLVSIDIYDEDYSKISADKYFEDIKKTHHLTMAAYNRLLCTLKIPEDVDRILYLDSDIIISRPLDDLYNQMDREHAAIVVEGFSFKDKDYLLLANNDLKKTENILNFSLDFRNKFGISEDSKYFNSGVMVINLDYLRKNNFVNRVKKHIISHECTPDADQSVLNIVLRDEVKYTSNIYNCRPSDYGKHNTTFLKKQAHVLHYGVKPWDEFKTSMSMKWWKYAFLTDAKGAIYIFLRIFYRKMRNCIKREK